MSKRKKQRDNNSTDGKMKLHQVTLAMPTNEDFEVLEALSTARKREAEQACSVAAEQRRTGAPASWTWHGIEVYEDEIVEGLVPAYIVGSGETPNVTAVVWCLLCRRLDTQWYLVPSLICLDECQDYLALRFEMKVDHKILYRQKGMVYKVNLSLRIVLNDLLNYQLDSDSATEFDQSLFFAVREIVFRHKQEPLNCAQFASTKYYALATAPLGNAMLIEAGAKTYGESEVERELHLYALGDAPRGEDVGWKMRFADARELPKKDWLMSDSLTELLLSDIPDEVIGDLFEGTVLATEELAGTVLEGVVRIELVPFIWTCCSGGIKVTYGINSPEWKIRDEMLCVDVGNFMIWYYPKRSTKGILMKKEV